MATLKELAQFIGITESGMKYKKKYHPAEFLLLELGYRYYQNMSGFDKLPLQRELEKKQKIADTLLENKRRKALERKEET